MLPQIKDQLPPPPGVRAEPVSLRAGEVYRFVGIRGPLRDGVQRWFYPPGDYRLLAVAQDVRTWQDRVVYQGVGGRDAGRVYVCGLEDWHRLFVPPADPPPPENPVGRISTEGDQMRGV